MKRLIFIVALLTICIANAKAQWVSPGNGDNYTLSNIIELSNGVVTQGDDNEYFITADLTISDNDVLTIDSTTTHITVYDQVTITIAGTLLCDIQPHIMFTGNNPTGNINGHFNVLFDNAEDCHIRGLYFCQGGGIKLIESDVHFEDCRFSDFNTQYTSQVINYFHCNPIIECCNFHDNDGAAIGSAANITGSPQILHSTFINNVLSNANTPQINLGPGAEDSILIVGNHIEGQSCDRSGGIAITDLVGTGSTKARISNNTVYKNRYGFTQQGYDISALIYDNIFLDNDLETNPMNGGSGISIFGYDNRCVAKARRNLISGNLWGITAIMNQNLDLGTADDPGYNVIFGNGNNGVSYELYNNSSNDLSAIGNYWGANEESHAEDVIYHNFDDASLGTVTFSPINTLHPHFISFALLQNDNAQLPHDIIGIIDVENSMVTLPVPEGICLEHIKVRFETPLGVDATCHSGDFLDLESPTDITLNTPHGENTIWTISAQISTNVEQHNTRKSTAFPNPATGNDITLQLPNEGTKNLTICNSLGQIILQTTTENEFITLKTKTFAPGLYILNIKNKEKEDILKIVF